MQAGRPTDAVGAGRPAAVRDAGDTSRRASGGLGAAARVAAHVGALLPLAILAYVAAADRLSANPIEDVTRRLGRDALLMLTLSLAVTPLAWLLENLGPRPGGAAAQAARSDRPGRRWRIGPWLISALRPLRRTFGLYAFFYALLHLFVFTVVDYGLDPTLLFDAALKKRYAFVGSTAFVILVVLAATSTRGWARRLGPAWRTLHRLLYPAAVLVVLHNLWAAKVVTGGRLAWAALIAALLLARIVMWFAARHLSAPPIAAAAAPPATKAPPPSGC